MTIHSIESQVISDIKGGFRLKVSILDLGMYIAGFTARYSDKNESGLWIQPPATKVGEKWISVVEFNKNKVIWEEIEKSIIEAVNMYTIPDNSYEELTQEEINLSISKAVDNFNRNSPGNH
ncbi:MAG: hypothetical protein WCJ72_02560 [Chryseobacterium sp.]|jgi:hypothetical protein